ncbi:MAG TPA: phosphate signaling complex protein PhoU [Planctomycetota bacterium]|nr:phosphate signaling complex protein PhoU [Planctomycetota bacterium]
MTKHLLHDLDRLKKSLLTMGAMVEEATHRAIASLVERRPELAEQVLEGDDAIDNRELEIEEDCLKILALHSPVAGDLRFIVAVMKVTNDLERMGDLAQNIAERAQYLTTHEPLDAPIDFARMLEKVRAMVTRSLDSLVEQDTALARRVLAQDDEVDDLQKHMFSVLQDLMQRRPDTVERAVQTLSVARHLERIADHATNIAEDVVFMVEGEILRHHPERWARESSDSDRTRTSPR